MPKAVVDPEDLRRFAQNLKRFNSDLRDGMMSMHGQLISLGDTWRDQEHDKFVEEFQNTLQVIERFLEASNEHIPFLLRKAEHIEAYLQR